MILFYTPSAHIKKCLKTMCEEFGITEKMLMDIILEQAIKSFQEACNEYQPTSSSDTESQEA